MVGLVNISAIPGYRYGYKGYCSIVNQVISIALEHYIVHGNTELVIVDEQVDMCFDKVYAGTGFDYDASQDFLQKYRSGKLSYDHEAFNSHTVCNDTDLKLKKMILDSILRLKPCVISDTNGFNHGCTTGIHMRGTDKNTEVPEIGFGTIFGIVDSCEGKVFLATDDSRYIDRMVGRYGDRIVYDGSNIHGETAVHFSCADRLTVNRQVIKECLLLSRLETFYYCFSNVSHLALVMGYGDNKKMRINTNTHE